MMIRCILLLSLATLVQSMTCWCNASLSEYLDPILKQMPNAPNPICDDKKGTCDLGVIPEASGVIATCAYWESANAILNGKYYCSVGQEASTFHTILPSLDNAEAQVHQCAEEFCDAAPPFGSEAEMTTFSTKTEPPVQPLQSTEAATLTRSRPLQLKSSYGARTRATTTLTKVFNYEPSQQPVPEPQLLPAKEGDKTLEVKLMDETSQQPFAQTWSPTELVNRSMSIAVQQPSIFMGALKEESQLNLTWLGDSNDTMAGSPWYNTSETVRLSAMLALLCILSFLA